MATIIPLTKGKSAIIDDDDLVKVLPYRWEAWYSKNTDSFYARCRPCVNRKQITIYMHRLLLNLHAGDKRQGDHKNHDTLDNQRSSNLRICKKSKFNQRNQLKKKGTRFIFKGVRQSKSGKFFAQIKLDGKNIHSGTTSIIEDAAFYYDIIAKKVYGEFAATNRDLGIIPSDYKPSTRPRMYTSTKLKLKELGIKL